jgi:hypothetical protein
MSRLLDEKEEETSSLCTGQSGQRRQDDRKRRQRGGKSGRRSVKTWKIASLDGLPSKGGLVFTFPDVEKHKTIEPVPKKFYI